MCNFSTYDRMIIRQEKNSILKSITELKGVETALLVLSRKTPFLMGAINELMTVRLSLDESVRALKQVLDKGGKK